MVLVDWANANIIIIRFHEILKQSVLSTPFDILRSAKRMADQRRGVRTDPVSGNIAEMWLWHNLCPFGYLQHQQHFGQGLGWQLTPNLLP